MSILELGDEGLARKLGPVRIALWFDENQDYRAGNERFWRVRRALLRSEIWDRYGFDLVPLIPEWFGALLPAALAYRESGYPWIWCTVLGFPTKSIQRRALELVEAESPSGLVKVESDPPDPSKYTLPLVGFLARSIYLTLEPGHPRRYDSWRGYETLGLVDEDGLGLSEWLGLEEAERSLLHLLALNVGKTLEAPDGDSDLGALVDHARELWALQAVAAAGAVAGTAMERLLCLSLPAADRRWGERQTLAPLIDKVVKEHAISPSQAELLHDFRLLRNTCAHSLSGEEASDTQGLASAVDHWLTWLESNEKGEVGVRPGDVEVLPERPPPPELHALAHDAGVLAAEDITPVPMRLSGEPGGVEEIPEGVCGYAEVLLADSDDLSRWLVREGKAESDDGKVRLSAYRKSQSMERAVAYARAYVETVRRFGVAADYRTWID